MSTPVPDASANAGGGQSRTVHVGAMARVEGEGGLTIRLRDGMVEEVQLRIFEAPRFFEAFLRGRDAMEAPDITARICGICPVAYQMSAVHAIERIFGVELAPEIRLLRRILYCGEWIESHTLHIYMLQAPDFLGFDSAVAMAQASASLRDLVRRALHIKKAGNALVTLIGGREIHPINVRVGGFYRAPTRAQFMPVAEELRWARDAALETVRWAASLEIPEFGSDYEFVALVHPDEYPMNEGRIASSSGLNVEQHEFPQYFEEYQVPHSNALQSRRLYPVAASGATPNQLDPDGGLMNGKRPYFVGPLARWNLNAQRAPTVVREAAAQANLLAPVRNPFAGIIVRALELLLAIDEALRLIELYEPPTPPAATVNQRAGTGHAVTEAPRGLLYHRYATDEAGIIRAATIIPPTAQNQSQMEHDLTRLAPELAQLPHDEAALKAEKVIRNYDPCISCATHFLKLKVIGT